MSRLISDKSRKILILFITFLFLINFIILPINASEKSPELKLYVHLPIPDLVEGQESEFIIEVINDDAEALRPQKIATLPLFTNLHPK